MNIGVGTVARFAAVGMLVAGCGASGGSPASSPPAVTSSSVVAPSSAGAVPTTSGTQHGAPAGGAPSSMPPKGPASPTPLGGATPAPRWLGTRVLPIGPDGFGIASATPKALRTRRIITTDLLPPPADGTFHSHIEAVPTKVARRSTWSPGCPVSLHQLRYVTVSFRGFDGLAHTGELLVNRSAAAGLVRVFRMLFTGGWPIEQMRITSSADQNAPPTGDGNDTAAFACRAVRGASSWSQHAYGLAVDLDPFQNPYVSGDTVLPELARAYTDRDRTAPGIIHRNSLPVRAFGSIGWGWGGNFRSKKDFMHFSSTGG